MVQFGKQLVHERVPEWATAYVDYRALKKALGRLTAALEETSESDDKQELLLGASTSEDEEEHLKAPPPSSLESTSSRRRYNAGAASSGGSSMGRGASRGPRRSSALISACMSGHSPAATVHGESMPPVAREPLRRFWQLLDAEVAKCEGFFRGQEASFEARFEDILAALQRHRKQAIFAPPPPPSAPLLSPPPQPPAARSLEPASPSASPDDGGARPAFFAPISQRRLSSGLSMDEVAIWLAEAKLDEKEEAEPPGLASPNRELKRRAPHTPRDPHSAEHFELPVRPAPPPPPPPISVQLSEAPSTAAAASVAVRRRESRQLRRAMTEYYRGLKLLLSFARLNFLAVVKITKKHDKSCAFHGAGCSPLYVPLVEKCAFRASEHKLEALARAIEREFVLLEHQDASSSPDGRGSPVGSGLRLRRKERRMALSNLRPDPETAPGSRLLLFSGFLGGVCVAALMMVATQLRELEWGPQLVPVVRGPLLVLLHFAAHGGAVAGWAQARISASFIFGSGGGGGTLAQRGMNYADYFLIAGLLASFWLLLWAAVLLFVRVDAFSHLLAVPPLLFCLALAAAAVPLPPGMRCWPASNSRAFFAGSWLRMLTAPLWPIRMADFFLADQLVSEQTAPCDLLYIVVWYTHGDFLRPSGPGGGLPLRLRLLASLLPFWIRILQCARRLHDCRQWRRIHVINAAKYGVGAASVVCHAFWQQRATEDRALLAAFIATSAASALYSFFWDLRMDWGLLSGASGEGDEEGGSHRLLRPMLLAGPASSYYAAIGLNAALRGAWLMQLAPGAADWPVGMTSLLAALEVLRRCGWNYLRVENEHVANTEAMTPVAHLPLPNFSRPPRGAGPARSSSPPPLSPSPPPSAERTVLGRLLAAFSPAPPASAARSSAWAAEEEESRTWARRGEELADIGLAAEAAAEAEARRPVVTPSPARTRRLELGEHFTWGGDEDAE